MQAVVALMLLGTACASTKEYAVKTDSEPAVDCVKRFRNNRRQLAKCLATQRRQCSVLLASNKITVKKLKEERDGETLTVTRRICFGTGLKKCVVTTCPQHKPNFWAGVWRDLKAFARVGGAVGFIVWLATL